MYYDWENLLLFFAFIVCVLLANKVYGADNSAVSVATSRGATSNYDEITVGTTSCRQAMISATQLEFGVGAAQSNEDNPVDDFTDANDAVVFARVTYQLGMPKRMDCSRIYEMELERLRFELQQLRQVSN